MTPELLSELVSKRIAGIDMAVIQIGLGRDVKDAEVTIRAHLIDLLGLLERNAGLDAAADDLYKCVRAVVVARDSGSIEDRQLRLLGKAHARLRDRLTAAGVIFTE